MKITVNLFDADSMAAAINDVRQRQKDFLVKEQEFARRLAEIGATVARAGYASSADYNDAQGVNVRIQKNANGYSVFAEGETVGFIEFGTGIRNREWNNGGMDYTPPAHGTYGEGHGAQPWGWWYRPKDGRPAVHTYGEVPVEAMRMSRDEMVANVHRIAREVWR